jgi:DNA-directed RNA polymerase specialized sigma subunit
MRGLPKRTRYLIEQHYFHGRMVHEIGQELGIGSTRSSQGHEG